MERALRSLADTSKKPLLFRAIVRSGTNGGDEIAGKN